MTIFNLTSESVENSLKNNNDYIEVANTVHCSVHIISNKGRIVHYAQRAVFVGVAGFVSVCAAKHPSERGAHLFASLAGVASVAARTRIKTPLQFIVTRNDFSIRRMKERANPNQVGSLARCAQTCLCANEFAHCDFFRF